MALNNVSSGKDLPNDFNVIIEIPMYSDPMTDAAGEDARQKPAF